MNSIACSQMRALRKILLAMKAQPERDPSSREASVGEFASPAVVILVWLHPEIKLSVDLFLFVWFFLFFWQHFQSEIVPSRQLCYQCGFLPACGVPI